MNCCYLIFTDTIRRTGLPHIGDLIQKRRHALFGHVARMDPQAPAHVALKLCRDIAMGRRVSLGCKRPRGRPHTVWSDQLMKDRVKIAKTNGEAANVRLGGFDLEQLFVKGVDGPVDVTFARRLHLHQL